MQNQNAIPKLCLCKSSLLYNVYDYLEEGLPSSFMPENVDVVVILALWISTNVPYQQFSNCREESMMSSDDANNL